MVDRDADRAAAIAWARELLSSTNLVLLDCETTGLDEDAEIVSIGILSPHGHVLLDALVRPSQPIPPAASAVHGIYDRHVEHALRWTALSPVVLDLLNARTVAIYNADFDVRMLAQTCARYEMPMPRMVTTCVMREYAAYVGDWSPWREGYRWQPLTGGDHSAVGDCRAVLRLIHTMAELKERQT